MSAPREPTTGLALALTALALVGCAQATQIVLVVDSDLTLTTVDVDVSSTRSPTTRASVDFALPGAPTLPLTLALYPRAGADPDVFVTVTGHTAGSTVERRVRTRFAAGGSRMLRVILAARCVGVRCGPGETCDETGCRAIELPSSELAPWSGAPPGHLVGSACAPSAERCNGADDDCDMTVDEDFDLAVDGENCGACGHPCAGPCSAGFCAGEAIASLAAGGAHTCAVRESGEVLCWGWNLEGQLGASGPDASTPTLVAGIRSGGTVTAGALHTCVTDATGVAACFGDGESGALGRASRADDSRPGPVGGTTTFDSVEAGPGYSCGVTGAGAVVCWGANESGQLGLGGTARNDAPGASAVEGALDLAVGFRHACAIRSDHTLWCWGDDSMGQIGGGGAPIGTPAAVAGVTDALRVAAGREFTCFARMDGTVACLGANDQGQLGDGGMLGSTSTPIAVPGIDDVLDLAAASGGTHVCVVRAGGLVNCWGGNASGQLGDGTREGGASPVLALDVSDVIAVAAGGLASDGTGHTCALDASGRVSCWGDGALGQLGASDTMQRSRAVRVLGYDSP